MSIAIPNATLNTKTVDGFMAIPTQPIKPAVMINGIKLGMSEAIKIRIDLKR